MTVGYKITELGLANLDVDPRLDKRPSKDGVTLNDVLSILDDRFLGPDIHSLSVSDEYVAQRLKADSRRTEHLLDRLTQMGYVSKSGRNRMQA
jgi:hypothetical protein